VHRRANRANASPYGLSGPGSHSATQEPKSASNPRMTGRRQLPQRTALARRVAPVPASSRPSAISRASMAGVHRRSLVGRVVIGITALGVAEGQLFFMINFWVRRNASMGYPYGVYPTGRT